MTKSEILKLIDENPYWGEDAESVIMIRDLKKWFEFNLKEIDDKEISKDDDSCEFVTKKEFRFEINRLWNEIRQISCKFVRNSDPGTGAGIYPYPNTTSVNIPYITFT